MNTKIIALFIVCILASVSAIAKAAREDICLLPCEMGLCRGDFKRYAFDSASNQCVPFIWGGCGGNANNFQTIEECYDACGHNKNNRGTNKGRNLMLRP